ncbi:MAG: hypothetical protein HLUCCA04_06540 [Oceanicaulis sp. HLUCCA04]|nr:MAG: hypothetical protein HLUCCA04_06540 [Oceanicaulis sp. HLUCCA04]
MLTRKISAVAIAGVLCIALSSCLRYDPTQIEITATIAEGVEIERTTVTVCRDTYDTNIADRQISWGGEASCEGGIVFTATLADGQELASEAVYVANGYEYLNIDYNINMDSIDIVNYRISTSDENNN